MYWCSCALPFARLLVWVGVVHGDAAALFQSALTCWYTALPRSERVLTEKTKHENYPHHDYYNNKNLEHSFKHLSFQESWGAFVKLRPVHEKSTHPVDVRVAFWNDVAVEEGGFTRCGEREEGARSESCGRKERSEISDTPSTFLTCGETHGNNDFCFVGGERGRWRVVKWCSAVNLPLKVSMNKNINTNTDQRTANACMFIALTGSKLGRL